MKEAAASKKAASTKMWAQIVKQGAEGGEVAAASTPEPPQTPVDRQAPQSATHGLRKGLTAVTLETPRAATAAMPALETPRAAAAAADKPDVTPQRVLTAADILRAGGIPPRPQPPLVKPAEAIVEKPRAATPEKAPQAR